jgi:hypothetical protein
VLGDYASNEPQRADRVKPRFPKNLVSYGLFGLDLQGGTQRGWRTSLITKTREGFFDKPKSHARWALPLWKTSVNPVEISISPTHEGVVRNLAGASRSIAYLPHARGGCPAAYVVTNRHCKSPPRTRGLSVHIRLSLAAFGISPTHEGGCPPRCVPGLRDDVSPPRTRGLSETTQPRRRGTLISPMHEGVVRGSARTNALPRNLPHARGG